MFNWVSKLGIGRNVQVEDVSTGEIYVVKGFGKEGMVEVRDKGGRRKSVFGGNLKRTEDQPASEGSHSGWGLDW